MSSFTIPELIDEVAAEMRLSLKQRLIPHPGELGTAREEIVRQFLRNYLPKRFGVSTGFVFDAQGNISRQVDIIIYDTLLCPQFQVTGEKKFYPCESVVCVGEVKSVLTSSRDVNKAFENLRSVKSLDRSANGVNLVAGKGDLINQQENHLDQVFSFLFVIDASLKAETMREALFSYLCDNQRHLWPNLIFSFDNYLLTYHCNDGVCPNPMDAWGISSVTNESEEKLLLKFYSLLARAVEVTHVSTFSYWEYLQLDGLWTRDLCHFSEMPFEADVRTHCVKSAPS